MGDMSNFLNLISTVNGNNKKLNDIIIPGSTEDYKSTVEDIIKFNEEKKYKSICDEINRNLAIKPNKYISRFIVDKDLKIKYISLIKEYGYGTIYYSKDGRPSQSNENDEYFKSEDIDLLIKVFTNYCDAVDDLKKLRDFLLSIPPMAYMGDQDSWRKEFDKEKQELIESATIEKAIQKMNNMRVAYDDMYREKVYIIPNNIIDVYFYFHDSSYHSDINTNMKIPLPIKEHKILFFKYKEKRKYHHINLKYYINDALYKDDVVICKLIGLYTILDILGDEIFTSFTDSFLFIFNKLDEYNEYTNKLNVPIEETTVLYEDIVSLIDTMYQFVSDLVKPILDDQFNYLVYGKECNLKKKQEEIMNNELLAKNKIDDTRREIEIRKSFFNQINQS